MDVLGLDIAKAHCDAHLICAAVTRHTSFPNTQAGFEQLAVWLARHRPSPTEPLHACMEATGNWGLDLAAFLYQAGFKVSIVNPRRIKAFGESELARNKTDKLDAALIARFCRAHAPMAWTPPAAEMRELRELVRRCAALKANRTQEINRQKAALVLAELPNIAEFTPKGLAAFTGLSPQEHSSGERQRFGGISRIGNAVLRSALFLCALSARRHNPRLAAFVRRMTEAHKPNKVILIALARKLLVMAHAVIRTQTPFNADAAA